MPTVGIEYKNKKNFSVIFPDSTVVDTVTKFLNTEREFYIPESKNIDDYRIDKAKPVEHITYFELALCVLHANTGIWVKW